MATLDWSQCPAGASIEEQTAFLSCYSRVSMEFTLDYDKLLFLDAEALAEAGIKEAYDSMVPDLRHYVSEPAELQEVLDNDAPSYAVKCCDLEYVIYSPALAEEEGSWGRATHAFFRIVNDQLTKSQHRLYAINGCNELSGMFLTQAECEAARRALQRKEDWPYLPTLEDPWYGQHHG